MKFFNARFDLSNVNYLTDSSQFELTGNVVDNSGLFSSIDASVNDIIYIDGSALGAGLLRYKILNIISASGLQLIAEVQWDMPGDPVAPLPVDGIIGKGIENSELSIITNINTNLASELLISNARSYEQSLIAKSTNAIESKIVIPTIGYTDVVE